MPAPYDYSINVQSPFESAVSGLKLGATIADIRTQQEAAAKAQERQNMLNQGLQALISNPNPTARDFTNIAMLLPEKEAASLRANWETLNKDQQDNELRFGGQVMSAFSTGAPQVGINLLEQRAEAEDNAGRADRAKAYRTYAEIAKSNPSAAHKTIGIILASVPGGDKVIESVSKLQGSAADSELRAVMSGVETVDDVFNRIPQLAQLGDKGMEYAKNLLTQQRLMEKQRAEGIGMEDQRAEENNAITKAYGLLKTVMPDGAFELKKIGSRYDISTSNSFSDIIKTSGGIQINETKAGMLGIDRETMAAIQGIAQTDPKMAANMIADVVKARIKQQFAPQKAQRMSPAALKLIEAGYEYGSPEFVRQMKQEITAERAGKEKGQGVSITNVMDKAAGGEAGKLFDVWYESASSGNQQLRDIDVYEDAVSKAITGPFANTRMKGAQIASMLGLGGEEAVGSTRALLQGLSEMTLSARGMLKGQGSITDSEQKILSQARGGDINMTANEFKILFGAVRRAVKAKTERDTRMLSRAAASGSEVARMYLDEVETGAYRPRSKQQPQKSNAPVSVTAPNGQVLTFPSQQAADAFKKAAGIR